MTINLWALFEAVSDAVPEREAIIWRERRLTYADVRDQARRLAGVLAAHGIGLRRERGELANWESGQDMVGLYLLNGPEYLVGTLGSYAARAAAFNVNFRYVAGELAYLLDDAQAAALVYHARFAPVLAEVLGQLDRRPLLLQVADESGEALLPGALDYDEALAAAAEPPQPRPLARRPLRALHRRHDGDAQGHALAPGRHLHRGLPAARRHHHATSTSWRPWPRRPAPAIASCRTRRSCTGPRTGSACGRC